MTPKKVESTFSVPEQRTPIVGRPLWSNVVFALDVSEPEVRPMMKRMGRGAVLQRGLLSRFQTKLLFGGSGARVDQSVVQPLRVSLGANHSSFYLEFSLRTPLGSTVQASTVFEVDRAMVLGNATSRAAEALGLNGRALAEVVGLSEPTVSRIGRGDRGIDPASKGGQLSLMLVRVSRSLDAVVGGDAAKRRVWLTTHNVALNGIPLALILSAERLTRTLTYLDGMRAPI